MKKLLLTIALAASTGMVYAQGTIQFANAFNTLFTLQTAAGTVSSIPVGTSLNFGLFWGADLAAAMADQAPEVPLGAMGTSAGRLAVANGNAYVVEGGAPGARIFVQVRGWSASFGSDWRAAMMAFQSGTPGVIFGETDIRQLGTAGLGPVGGPGSALWQGFTGTNPNLLQALRVYEAPEPSVIGLAIIGLGSLVFLRRRK